MLQHDVRDTGPSRRGLVWIGIAVAAAVAALVWVRWVRKPVIGPMPKAGRFEPAMPHLMLLDDGRRAELLEPFTYIDGKEKRWPVPKGWRVDGASIPQPLWSVVGGPFEGKYRYASIVHDYYCDQPQGVHWEDVHKMYYEACLAGGYDEEMAGWMFALVYRYGPHWDPSEKSRRQNGAEPPAPPQLLAAEQSALAYETRRLSSERVMLTTSAKTEDPVTLRAATRIDAKALAPLALQRITDVRGTRGGTVALVTHPPSNVNFTTPTLPISIDPTARKQIHDIARRGRGEMLRKAPPLTATTPLSPPDFPATAPTSVPADLQVITLTDATSKPILFGAAPADEFAAEVERLNRVKTLLQTSKDANQTATADELEAELQKPVTVP